MKPLRNQDGYTTLVDRFLKDILVKCPSCDKKALVQNKSTVTEEGRHYKVALTCLHCGHNKINLQKPMATLFSKSVQGIPGNFVLVGAAVDPYFKLPLWLQANVGEYVLWAYNYEHLIFLQQHVAATLRERKGEEKMNQSLGSRLPRWMTSAKNREKVVHYIEELKKY